MKKVVMFSVIALFLFGCLGVPPFEIISLQDKFSSKEDNLGYSGLNNRLTNKSTMGGVHIDNTGIFLNPFVWKNQKTKEITHLGFHFQHITADVNMGFNFIENIVFLTKEGTRIELNFTNRDFDFKVNDWNSVTGEFNTKHKESAFCKISKQNFLALSNSKGYDVKLTGNNLNLTLTPSEVDIKFMLNLKKFAKEQL